MNDVAQAAEVSLKTVSRFINGESNIDPRLAARVDQAVRDLGYRRNLAAASLRPGWTSKLVGLVISDLGNPFYSTLAGVIEEEIAGHGYVLTVSSSSDRAERFNEVLNRFMELRVDGLVIVPPRTPGTFRLLESELNAPVVFVDRPGHMGDSDSVLADNHGGAKAGTQALLNAGARRVAFVGDSLDVFTMRKRLGGFEEAVREAGLPLGDMPIFSGAHSVEEGLAAAISLMNSTPIDGFFAANNRASLGILRAYDHVGRKLPLVGFDDFETADLIGGGLSIIRQDVRTMAQEAARLLLARIHGEAVLPQESIIPTAYVSRGSEAVR